MADIYEYPNESVKDILGYSEYVSQVTDGLLFPIILLVIGVISFIGTKSFTAPVAFAFSSFLVSILSIIMAILGLINPTYMYFCFVLSAFSILWLRMSKG